MAIKQVSVFAVNRPNSLLTLTGILKEANVSIRAMSIADTHDYGIVRLVVDNTFAAASSLKSSDNLVSVDDVIAVKIDDEKGSLNALLGTLAENEINMEYIYSFLLPTKGACIVIRVLNPEQVESILVKSGFSLMTDEMIKEL